MNRSHLIADVLNEQHEFVAPGEPSTMAGHWSERLRSVEPLARAEIALIWRSPAVRRAYLNGRKMAAVAARGAWAAGGWGAQLSLQAASSPFDGFTLTVDGVQVIVTAVDERWLVAATVTPAAMAQVPSGLALAFSDSGGHEWLRVPASADGHAEAWWTLNETPRERLQAGPLAIGIR